VKQSSAPEFAAIEWLRDREGHPVVAQAVGQGYRWETSRIASASGLPTVLGWKGHEEQWRGGSEETNPRDEDLRKLYTSTSAEDVRSVVAKYNIRYVVVGPIEREIYQTPTISELGEVFQPVLDQGDVILYQVRAGTEGEATQE
jgi:uncharacterized membrane protein